MSDKDFKVKNKLILNGLAGNAGPLIASASNVVDSTPYIPTQYGGTGTTTSPSSGQVLYSSGGTTYSPTTLADLVTGAKYQADAPSSPAVGQIWIESDSTSDVFDQNIIRRQAFTATSSQTVFTTAQTFIDGYEQVYFNGLLLLRGSDYTTSTNNTVTLSSAAAAGDIIEVVTITNLNSYNPNLYSSISSNTNLTVGYRYFVTSASALTLTLPGSPSVNDQIDIFDASGNASTYNITVSRNGKLINGNAGNFIIDVNGSWYTLVFTGNTYGWKVA